MRRRTFLLCATFMATLCGARLGPAQVDTTRVYAFGDSLTDNDYVFFIFGTDPFIYGADPTEAMFDKASFPGDELHNFAVLGSTTADVLAQVEAYVEALEAGGIPPATLISLQGGGNDLLDPGTLLTLASAPPGENEDADKIMNGVKRNLMTALQALQVADGAPVVLWTVPDITLTPLVLSFGLGADAEQNIRMHIERLNQFLRAQGNRPDVAVLDVAFALTAVTLQPPVILGTQLTPTPDFGFASAIFADPFHPTAVSNAILANVVIEELNEKFDDNIPLYSEEELADLAGLNP